MSLKAVITGVGAYLPKRVMTNADLSQIVETSDEWIRERTGIVQRHIVAEDETTSDLATLAAAAALKSAGLSPADIDMIVVATSTPDLTMPSTATLVQRKLGARNGIAFDMAAACSGFVYGMGIVNSALQSGLAKRALLIGAETMSRIIDWQDRGTCILFGDGAGAVVLEAKPDSQAGILGVTLNADGNFSDILATNGGISANKLAGHLFMQGQEVFRHGVEKMSGAAVDLLGQCGLTISDVAWFVPHQANARMIQSIARKLNVAPEKFIVTLTHHANTSAASIPLALDAAVRDGRIKTGDIVVAPALGAGLTWGCCIIKWV